MRSCKGEAEMVRDRVKLTYGCHKGTWPWVNGYQARQEGLREGGTAREAGGELSRPGGRLARCKAESGRGGGRAVSQGEEGLERMREWSGS